MFFELIKLWKLFFELNIISDNITDIEKQFWNIDSHYKTLILVLIRLQ